jgi:hypothetical protein
LLWPTIQNETDFDYVTRQGFWICALVAAMTLLVNILAGSAISGFLESLFFFLAGVGVRERSRIAAISAFSAYFLSALVMQRFTHHGFGIIRIIFLAMLFAKFEATGFLRDGRRKSARPMAASRTKF